MKTKQLSTFFFFLLCFVIMNVYCNHKLQQFTIAKYGLQNKIKEQKNNNNKPKKQKRNDKIYLMFLNYQRKQTIICLLVYILFIFIFFLSQTIN